MTVGWRWRYALMMAMGTREEKKKQLVFRPKESLNYITVTRIQIIEYRTSVIAGINFITF